MSSLAVFLHLGDGEGVSEVEASIHVRVWECHKVLVITPAVSEERRENERYMII